MKYNAVITVLWAVTWGTDEHHSTPAVYFENEADATKVSKLRLGWYNSTGSILEVKYIDGAGVPSKTYISVKAWADDTLTPNKAKEYGI